MVCSKNKCTGCFACYNICPKKAISMEKDIFGNIYPKIDSSKCINCLLCKKICPQLSNNTCFSTPLKTYALFRKEKKERIESSSGGMASLFGEFILKNGGVVYGVSSFILEGEFKFVRIDSIDMLSCLKGSKYVHSYIKDTYLLIKDDLNNKKNVLFIGTPCQVDGLYHFLSKDYSNLFTIDLICHGVSNQKLFFEELEQQNINSSNVSRVSFRTSNLYELKLFDSNNNLIFCKQADLVDYYRNFLNGSTYRKNCYSCRYAKNKRIANITLGDFWGLDKSSSIYDNANLGISLMLINNKKGEYLFNKVKHMCKYEERSFNEAATFNKQLNSPVKISEKSKIFYDNYAKIGYSRTMKKMLSLKEKIILFIKRNKLLYNFIKKMIK